VVYRPTVHYSYHPCDSAVVSVHEFAGRNWHLQDRQRILLDEIISGADDSACCSPATRKTLTGTGPS
jgi:homospermidine synthase